MPAFELAWLRALSDAVIAISFVTIAIGIVWYMRHRLGMMREYRRVAWLFSGFIFAAGVCHLLAVMAQSYPLGGLVTAANAATALLAVAAVMLIWPQLPVLSALPSSRELAAVNDRLRREAQAHEATLRELDLWRRELESRVEQRTHELSLAKARFETALHGAKIYVFSQDRDLKYTWMYGAIDEAAAAGMIGRADRELLAAPERDTIIALKQRVLDTGRPADCEVSTVVPGRRALFALHVDPAFGKDGSVDGITCAAVDISRIRSLESEQRRLTDELGTALQRYEAALRGSHVTIYTHDLHLRYTTVSNLLFGFESADIVGRLDRDILPPESAAPMVALKRGVLDNGKPDDAEIRVMHGGDEHWYDMHIEPLRDTDGEIVGLTCAAVDITARKADEAHMRDIMRELTHRSKNLLAVIQAMARQTARHSTTAEMFLDRFAARLQALSASHDLLVLESWHGASLSELVRAQLAHYLDRESAQVAVDGPALLLKPEAAQGLSLAIHELATNAAKYGGLSTPSGRVVIEWRLLEDAGGGVELQWTESGGPQVEPPERRGFGSMVIERNLAHALDAEVNLEFPPAGARCRMRIPMSNLAGGR